VLFIFFILNDALIVCSGKTLAFGIPALVRIIARKKKKSVVVLVVAPTRELAIQTHETLTVLGEPFGITSVAVYGGVSKDTQVKDLARSSARIIVGTPGRILDLVNDGTCNLKQCVFFLSFCNPPCSSSHRRIVAVLTISFSTRRIACSTRDSRTTSAPSSRTQSKAQSVRP
jgi:hypothetical protein